MASAPARSRRSMTATPSRRSASISRSPERCHISHSAASARAAAFASPPSSAFKPSSSVMSPQACVESAPRARWASVMTARFTGKVVLIIGGAGGIGRAAAVRFASEGARVVLVDLAASALVHSVAAVEKTGAEVLAVEADVSKLAHAERYADAAVKQFGGIDVFFNNAG